MNIKISGVDDTINMLNRSQEVLQTAIFNGMNDVLNTIGMETAVHHLQGPRPIKLGIVTGRLVKSFIGRIHYEKGSVDVGNNYSIHKIHKTGNSIFGIKGTRAIAPNGFDYPAYWEYNGSRHGGKRPFLEPAVRAVSGQLPQIFAKSIEDKLKDFK